MRLPFKIALRFLTSSKGQTILIALGIAIGVSVQIFIGLLIQGLQKSLVDTTIGNTSQITVVSNKDDKTIENWEKRISQIGTLGESITYLSAASDGSAFVKLLKKTEPVLIRGLTLDKSDNIYKIRKNLINGNMPYKLSEVIIGKDLSIKLGIGIGNDINVFTATGKNYKLHISGIFDFKVTALNNTWLITDIKTSQDIFDYGNKVTSIEMQVKEIFKADKLAVSVKSVLSDGSVSVLDWKTQNAQLLSGLNGQSISSYMIQFFVLIAVILGIASVLAITVLQKSKQIGILKAMGIRDRTASLIFLFQGLILGFIGAILGILFGLGLSIMFTKFAVNPDGTPVIALYLNYGFIVFSGLIALISAVLASLIPAKRSSKLNPIEVIKNG